VIQNADDAKRDDEQADEEGDMAPVGRWKIERKHVGPLVNKAAILGSSHFDIVNNCCQIKGRLLRNDCFNKIFVVGVQAVQDRVSAGRRPGKWLRRSQG
jgi:hypothetical protein